MNRFRDHIVSLPALLRELYPVFVEEARRVVAQSSLHTMQRLHLIGCGDSYMAALAAELAFEMIAGVPAEPQNAMTFARYAAEFVPTEGVAVIGISVSGGVSRTIEGVLRARKRGMCTLAVTSASHTPIAQAAEHIATTRVPDLPTPDGVQVPGARSYIASMLMLYALALAIAEARGHHTSAWHATLAAAAEATEATLTQCDAPARALAEQTRHAPVMVFCGSGPNYATALFGAAKVLEACGDHTVGQDVEEWAHLQYFAHTDATPTFLISAYERDASRAQEVKIAMQTIGCRVIEVSPQPDAALRTAPYPEVFAPLVMGIPLMLFAAYRAEVKGETYFRGFGGGRSIEGGGGISRIRTSQIVV